MELFLQEQMNVRAREEAVLCTLKGTLSLLHERGFKSEIAARKHILEAMSYLEEGISAHTVNIESRIRLLGKTAPAPKELTRDEVVEMARRIVEKLKRPGVININGTPHPWEYRKKLEGEGSGIAYNAEYIVNKEKRTVVALLRGFNFGDVNEKGIAKCDPDDCFNVHIGKAIALHRALGLEVPKEFLNAPQPTEARVGDIIRRIGSLGRPYERKLESIGAHRIRYTNDSGWDYANALDDARIVDDSREGE